MWSQRFDFSTVSGKNLGWESERLSPSLAADTEIDIQDTCSRLNLPYIQNNPDISIAPV